MALLKPFFNLTNHFFSISPTEFAKNLIEEEWGCFKYIGMPWTMILSLPVQERRALIHKHNLASYAAEEQAKVDSGNNRTYEGESINAFAKLEQSNRRGGK